MFRNNKRNIVSNTILKAAKTICYIHTKDE